MTAYVKMPAMLVMLLALVAPAASEEKPWREISSPHFRVITNGSEGAGRRVAREFEQMRSLFADQFPGFNVDSPAPLLILAPVDEETTKKLLPGFWLHSGGPKPGGVFIHGTERQFAVVRLDIIEDDRRNPDRFAVVYHEYVHTLLHLNFRWLPTWLDEGLAEYYAFTRFEGTRTYIGAPSRNRHMLDVFNSKSSIPLDRFLDRRNSFARTEQDTYLFYMQSWALTHFLTFGPGMEKGMRLKKFFNALQAGTEQKKAFEDTFGNLEQVRKNLDDYVGLFAFTAGVIPTPANVDEKAFASRTMTQAETWAELASFYLGSRQWKEARASAAEAIKVNPKLPLANEVLGFLDMGEDKDDLAVREFSQAVDLDGHMYLSLFAKTMLSPLPHSTSPGDRELFRAALVKVLDGNPKFAPAYVEWAKSFAAEGNLTRALPLARTAEKFQPWLGGYHLLSGEILLRAGHPAEAAALAAYVANRWTGPDHDEAMELWNRVPAVQRPKETPVDAIAPDLQSAEGAIKSVTCEDKQWTLTLDRGGQPLIFKIKGANGGFSDTLWFVAHFNQCYHVAGLRAVVRYKPTADKSAPDEVVSWAFRDDLPSPPASPESAKQNAKPN
jgi:hypothetical protein